MLLPFIVIPKNYGDVLNKLAGFAFYETYIITTVLRSNPTIDGFFTKIESLGPVGKAVASIPGLTVVNITGLLIAVVVALLTNMFQLHDRISDLLGIRRTFDRKFILIPLARLVGVQVTQASERSIAAKRDELMRSVFYRYTSSKAERPLVDRHDIEHALNAWSWFWVFVEAVPYFAIGFIFAWSFDSGSLAKMLLGVSLFCMAISILQYLRLGRYARPQISRIANDASAAEEVRQRFDAL